MKNPMTNYRFRLETDRIFNERSRLRYLRVAMACTKAYFQYLPGNLHWAWLRFRYQGRTGYYITRTRCMLINFFLRVFMPIRWKRLTAKYYNWTEKPVDVLSVIGPNEDADLVNANFPPIPGMVRVEGGRFIMGRCQEDIRSKHEVELATFYLGESKVTQREWLAVMDTNQSYFQGEDLPVERVCWEDAVEYCNRRSLAEGLTPCYRIGKRKAYICDWDANGYRLPTETEWRFAAAGGLLFEAGQGYRESPNRLGLKDMYSDIWEWVWDWGGVKDTKKPQKNPRGPKNGYARVLLGGNPLGCQRIREAEDFDLADENCYDMVFGFRVARSS